MILNSIRYEFGSASLFLTGDEYKKEIEELMPDFLDFIENNENGEIKKKFLIDKLSGDIDDAYYNLLYDLNNNHSWSDEEVIKWFLERMKIKFLYDYINVDDGKFLVMEIQNEIN